MKRLYLLTVAVLCFLCVSCSEGKFNELVAKENPNNLVYYELFVRSFADSDGDGIGDFNGVTANVDYFKNLGIEAIWFMPINESNSYHGYDVIDYNSVEKDYGTMDDFKHMVTTLNDNGIRVMIDFVINHTSDQHEWYKKSAANEGVYRDYYCWKNGNAFETFVGGMKDLNLENENVFNEIVNVANTYMDMGISGFRLDAAKHYFSPQKNTGVHVTTVAMKNYNFINKLRTELRKKNENVFIVSEVIEQSKVVAEYYNGADSSFNFDIADNIIEKASGSRSYLYDSALVNSYNYLKDVNENFIDSPFATNHDRDRIATSLSISNKAEEQMRLKLVAEMLMTLPGSPFIYYGDELGMYGGRKEGETVPGYDTAVYDEYRRLPLKLGNDSETSWINDMGLNDDISYETQKNDENSLFNVYKEMIQLRKDNIALRYGNTLQKINFESTIAGVNGFVRTYTFDKKTQNVMVLHNFSKATAKANFKYDKVLYASNGSTMENINGMSTIVVQLTDSQFKGYAK